MGMERDPHKIVAPLVKHFDEIVTTRCAHYKARDPSQLALALEGIDVALSDGGSVEQALPEVYAEADELVVAGSLYLVGAVRALVRDGALEAPLADVEVPDPKPMDA